MARKRKAEDVGTDREEHLQVVEDGPKEVAVLAYWSSLWTFLLSWERCTTHDWISPTLTLWHDGTYWRGSLHDRIHKAVSYSSSRDLDALLEYFSEGIRRGTLKWKASQAPH